MKQTYIVILSILLLVGILVPSFWQVEGSRGYDDSLTSFDDLEQQNFSFTNLPEYLRENFPEAIQQVCKSTIHYDLDRPFVAVRSEFHSVTNCLFNDAFSNVPGEIARQIEQKTTPEKASLIPLSATPFGDSSVCYFRNEHGKITDEELNLESFYEKLVGLGYRTRCGELGSYETVMHPYSACRVGEMVWAEYCGYQKFLWGKMRDDPSFSAEFQQEFAGRQPVYTDNDWRDFVLKERQDLFDELTKTKRAVLDTLLLYKEFEQNFRMHAWYVVLYDNFEEIRQTLENLRKTIDTYPMKFFNAATPPPT